MASRMLLFMPMVFTMIQYYGSNFRTIIAFTPSSDFVNLRRHKVSQQHRMLHSNKRTTPLPVLQNCMARSDDSGTTSAPGFAGIPTIEQLAKDPFMKQLSYSEFIVGVLLPEDNNRQTDVVLKRLRAQLSHADGIRGFMVIYLTTTATKTTPAALLTVLREIIDDRSWQESTDPSTYEKLKHNRDELITLACMNVIMPTGMVTIHEDPELSKQSLLTSQNAVGLLKEVYNSLDHHNDNNDSHDCKNLINEQLNAIITAAGLPLSTEKNGTTSNSKSVLYWVDFMKKWKYNEQQKKDISIAVQSILRG